MMRALYLRMAVAFAGALAVSGGAGLLTASSLKGQADADVARLVGGSGLGLLRHELERAPSAAWPAILQRARPHLDYPVRVEPLRPARASASLRGPLPPEIRLPIAETGQGLVLGPLDGPSLDPVVWPLVVFIATLVVVTSTLVSLPLATQLRRTQRAVRLIGEGRWDHRLNARAEGPLRSLAEHVNRTAEQLATLFQEREELLQAVSHELGTPLSRMRFQLALLEPGVPADQRSRIDHLQRDLDQLDALSSELVGWVEAGVPPRGSETFALYDVLAPLFEYACQDAGHLTARLEVEGAPTLCADLRPFQRAIENLVRNAVRYAASTVVLAGWTDGDQVVVEVRDDGPGIPEEQRARALEPFTRIGGSRSREEGGLGLGLAIVHRIVLAHDGQVTIGDAPEGGARVQTRWPTPLHCDP